MIKGVLVFGCWMLQARDGNPKPETRDGALEKKGKKGRGRTRYELTPLLSPAIEVPRCILPGTRISSYSPARHFLHDNCTEGTAPRRLDSAGWSQR